MAKQLIKRGAVVDARDSNGATPLHLAAGGTETFRNDCPPRNDMLVVTASLPGQAEVVERLLAAGADPMAKTKEGALPLGLAERAQRAVELTNERTQCLGVGLTFSPVEDFTEVMHLLSVAMQRR